MPCEHAFPWWGAIMLTMRGAVAAAALPPCVVQSWIWQLYTAMRAGKAGIKPLSGGSAAYKCVASYTAGFTV